MAGDGMGGDGMGGDRPNDPLHGMTLKAILEDLVERHGWYELGQQIRIRCFRSDPSMGSSLKFLRRNEWARRQVEELYLADHWAIRRREKRG